MSTRTTEPDWEVALEVFRLCLPRQSAKAKDDRLFLEALHLFAFHNITWRALPERFGYWNTLWRPFRRLSCRGAFENLFATLAELRSTAHLVQLFDSAVTRAPVSAAGAKGSSRVRRAGTRARFQHENPSEDGFRRSAISFETHRLALRENGHKLHILHALAAAFILIQSAHKTQSRKHLPNHRLHYLTLHQLSNARLHIGEVLKVTIYDLFA